MTTFRISQLAKRVAVPATTLRYYESVGLLPAARTATGYRSYSEADVERVRFIGAAKKLGLPLDRIRDLLAVWDSGLCREVRDELQPMVQDQIDATDRHLADLRAFRDHLDAALTHLRSLPARDAPCDPACEFLDRPATSTAPIRLDPPGSDPRSPAPERVEEVPVACSLDAEGYAKRAGRWRNVVRAAVREPLTEGGVRLRLPAVRAGEVAELVVAEHGCCPFLTFRLTLDGLRLTLDVHAPATAASLVAVLFAAQEDTTC